jgi:hypothetical protein
MVVQRKFERDIDLMLAEEFMVSSEFCISFLRRTRFKNTASRVVDVFVSKSEQMGESDLVVLFEEATGRRFALLIEDKINAPFQPDQALRYRNRGQAAVDRGEIADFAIVLCCPKAYFEAQPKSGLFDHFISYEDIAGFLGAESQERLNYRAEFIRTAAVRSINTWAKTDDQATTDFWEAVYQMASREFPILEMKRIDPTKGMTWLTLRPRDLPTKPKSVSILIKGDRGYVDLSFGATQVEEFGARVGLLLEEDMTVHQTGKSTVIRIETKPFVIDHGIESGLPILRSVFVASERLIRFYRMHRSSLDAAAQAAVLLR